MVTRYLQLGVLLFEGGFVIREHPLLRHGSPTAVGLLYSRLVYSLQHDKPVSRHAHWAACTTGLPTITTHCKNCMPHLSFPCIQLNRPEHHGSTKGMQPWYGVVRCGGDLGHEEACFSVQQLALGARVQQEGVAAEGEGPVQAKLVLGLVVGLPPSDIVVLHIQLLTASQGM